MTASSVLSLTLQAPAAPSTSRSRSRRRPAAAVAALDCSRRATQSSSSGDDANSPPCLLRRQLLSAAAAAALGAALRPQPAAAEGMLPRGYEETATKLVAALREAISTDLSDAEEREVRRAADPAKGLVKEFLTRWRDAPAVRGEESHRQLTAAIQQLGAFYQANGQRARMTPEVGQAILDALDAAEAALPEQAQTRSLLPFF